jgi:hypothetical protein
MDFKSLLSQLDQLNEAETKTNDTGRVHKGDYGTSYGKEDVRDQYGHKIGKVNKDVQAKKEEPKKGRGRPTKASQASGEDKKYDFTALSGDKKDVKLKPYDKKKTTKHSIKEYIDQLENALNEAEQIQIKPASQMPKTPGQTAGATSQPGQPQQVAGQPQKDTQVIAQGDKTLGTVNNPQLAQQIKQSIGKGEMTLMPDEMDEGILDTVKNAVRLGKKPPATTAEKVAAFHAANKGRNMPSSGNASDDYDYFTGRDKVLGGEKTTLDEKDIGKHNNATTGFDALVRKLTPKYGVEAAKRIAGSQMKKIKEADMPPHDSLASPLSLEEAKKGVNPFAKKSATKKKPDDDNDGVPNWADKKPGKDDNEGKKKGAAPKKGVNPFAKKKVKEGMDQQLQAARLEGKAHGLKGHSHCGKNYDDMEEARCYHEGYKEGLDECYGQMPIQGYVGENDTVNDMASYGAHTPEIADEGNAFTGALNRTPTGGKFSVGGKTFTDRSSIEESPWSMNENFSEWDNQLSSLLESKADVAEGMTVSISKGQQGSPDSVSVSAQDGEADQLLSLIKSAGLGLFGGDDQNGYGAPQGSTQAPGGIEVVDDHDGMMALMKKLTGQGGEEGGSADYADEVDSEEGHEEHGGEEACEVCGESSCGCHEGQEMVDEVESEDQMTYNVAEDNPPDSGAADTDAEIADTQQANSAASTYDAAESEDEAASDDAIDEDEETVEESLANGDDDKFETDIDFMTNVISGGLNKRKSTGQTTIPVVSTQLSRLGNPMQESTALLHDWKKLSGIN